MNEWRLRKLKKRRKEEKVDSCLHEVWKDEKKEEERKNNKRKDGKRLIERMKKRRNIR